MQCGREITLFDALKYIFIVVPSSNGLRYGTIIVVTLADRRLRPSPPSKTKVETGSTKRHDLTTIQPVENNYFHISCYQTWGNYFMSVIECDYDNFCIKRLRLRLHHKSRSIGLRLRRTTNHDY